MGDVQSLAAWRRGMRKCLSGWVHHRDANCGPAASSPSAGASRPGRTDSTGLQPPQLRGQRGVLLRQELDLPFQLRGLRGVPIDDPS